MRWSALAFCLLSLKAYSVSFSEIQQMAIEHSSMLKAQEMEARALGHDKDLKGKWANPQVMGQFGTLKSGPTQGATVEVSITQAVPLSDKYSLRKEMVEEAIKQASEQSQYFKNWVAHQAILSAWHAYAARELDHHSVERAGRMKLIKQYLESRPRVSVRQKVELAIVGSSLLQMQRAQDIKRHELSTALSDLEFWTGKKIAAKDLNFEIPAIDGLKITKVIEAQNDIELKAAERQYNISAYDADLAGKEKRPDLFLGGGYRIENVEPENHFTYAIVGLNIPLWDTGSQRASSAKARMKRDEFHREEVRKRVELKHAKQAEFVQLNFEQVKRFPPKMISLNENALKDAEVGFKQGVVDINTFIQAENQAHELIDQVYVSWTSYLSSLSDWQLMNGKELTW